MEEGSLKRILMIVVGIVALFLIISVMFLMLSKKVEKKSENNNAKFSSEEEIYMKAATEKNPGLCSLIKTDELKLRCINDASAPVSEGGI